MKKKEQEDIVPDTVHAEGQTREKRSVTTIVKVLLFDALIAGFLSVRRFLNLFLAWVTWVPAVPLAENWSTVKRGSNHSNYAPPLRSGFPWAHPRPTDSWRIQLLSRHSFNAAFTRGIAFLPSFSLAVRRPIFPFFPWILEREISKTNFNFTRSISFQGFTLYNSFTSIFNLYSAVALNQSNSSNLEIHLFSSHIYI